ncbi:MAG: vanadium-dependent haloperoxidase [Planctomycetes bacterium]|nr:vanadium-dependent haloperoxidase [Planctomycetota bacterium]
MVPSRRLPGALSAFVATGLLALHGCGAPPRSTPSSERSAPDATAEHVPSAAWRWLDVVLEACARDVERVGARPTILSRQMAIPMTAMFDAWAAYDDRAVGSWPGPSLRRPPAERTRRNQETAIAYAVYRTALDQLPHFADYLTGEMRAAGHDPDDRSLDPGTPVGIGNLVAAALLESRHHDGANQLGDEVGGDGTPYSDYTMYRPVNPPDRVLDPDRWQPIPFDDGRGSTVVLGFLTPHWYRVRPFALDRSDRFRPGPPPLVGSQQLADEVQECIDFNASLTPEQKAIVEFMRDGPRSTGQSGHWLRFAQAISVRDRNDLDRDVKLFFAVANVAFDAFIAAWDSKRYYDSSRPWTLVRVLHAGETLKGWAGPGRGVTDVPASAWHPYSPSTFITPPFPGYVSGHSCVSGACAELLKLFTGSDECGLTEPRHAGDLTEPGFSCLEMQQLDGRPLAELLGDAHRSCDVVLRLPTFTATAEMAGISRVMGGYHIQADNVAGLALGREVARFAWERIRRCYAGEPWP